ncbi:NAD(P)/FAD-dependent oxidoreductase [Edaphobacter aggregans]|uniref:NAD(P)/FAD-dependent oxidoreductase n=1 Tax=Edaphobacter aggregans TaxID=570835 RepID=UPI00068C64F9|nr:NAD(P)/FAD-dependent oxidoreductase [Edaphobacter aggregans]
MPNSPDLLIAGGGPAGLATAIAAACQGLSVVVTDSHRPSIDKACGEGLMPSAVEALARLGVHPDTTEHTPFRGVRFLDATAPCASAQGLFRSAPGIGIRRTRLHQLLLNRAHSLGVRFHWQTTVHAVENTDDGFIVAHTTAGLFRPRYLAGADGLHSRIRSLIGLEQIPYGRSRIGIRQHYAVVPHTDLVEVYWSPHGQAYVTPISASELCVAFVYRSRPSTRDHLSLFPALEARLCRATPIGVTRGAITLTRSLRQVTRGNIALVGDASGSVDAITGDGLALCFQQALALVQSISVDDLSSYQQAHARISRRPRLMSHLLLLMDRYPALCARVLRAFSRRPSLFPDLLSLHSGEEPLRLLGSGGLLASLLCLLSF